MMMNAKKGLSSHQVPRDLKLNPKTAWYMLTRIRKKMTDNDNKDVLFRSIIEADQTSIGGKPRRRTDDEGTCRRLIGAGPWKNEDSRCCGARWQGNPPSCNQSISLYDF